LRVTTTVSVSLVPPNTSRPVPRLIVLSGVFLLEDFLYHEIAFVLWVKI